MRTIIDEVESLEDETRFIIIDGKPRSLRAVIDRILEEDKGEKNRKIGEG